MNTTNDRSEAVLCISTQYQGIDLLGDLSRLGCRVILLTLDEFRDADWPRELLDEIHTMPGGMTQVQIRNTVTYLARTRNFACILPLGVEDMITAAVLREHMRIPGMGITTTNIFRDVAAMRSRAAHIGVRVPAFTLALNQQDLRLYMANVPAPWVLRPRCVSSTVDAENMEEPDQIWQALEKLGDSQSDFLLEQSISGEVLSAQGLCAEGKMQLQIVGAATNPAAESAAKAIHEELIPRLGMMRGAVHTKFLLSKQSGTLYFLETGAEPGGVSIPDAGEQPNEVNLRREWVRVEVAAMRGETYRPPHARNSCS